MAKSKRKRTADDDDDDDDLPRVGRPRGPETYGPPKPQPHEREEYFDRLQSILDAFEISDIPRDARLYLQRMLRRFDLLRGIDPKRFPTKGEEHVTLLLRVFESNNHAAALTVTTLQAVSGCMSYWVDRGLEGLAAFDRVDLAGLHTTLRNLGLEDQFERALRRKLGEILGPKPAPKKPPAPKMQKPAAVSQATWDDVLAMHKARKKRPKARMAA